MPRRNEQLGLPQAGFIDRIDALMEREQRSRYAGGQLGYVWAFITPITWIAFVVVFFRIIGRMPPIQVDVEVFVATGILPFALFRANITTIMRTTIANRHMKAFRRIDTSELSIAAGALEYATNLLTAIVIFGAMAILFGIPLPASLPMVLMAFGAVWILGVGVGALFASVGVISDSFSRAVNQLLRPMFWISGLFFTATELPSSAIELFWWNPLFHCIEALREGLFLGFHSPISNLWYPMSFGLLCYLFATLIMARVDAKELSRHPI